MNHKCACIYGAPWEVPLSAPASAVHLGFDLVCLRSWLCSSPSQAPHTLGQPACLLLSPDPSFCSFSVALSTSRLSLQVFGRIPVSSLCFPYTCQKPGAQAALDSFVSASPSGGNAGSCALPLNLPSIIQVRPADVWTLRCHACWNTSETFMELARKITIKS